ncbi:hypothetical protein AB0L70_03225 [Kribbella sp. NPDC051952]|uniref:hypothetical protein n=1 Tax=Kribbella sp. NPDC051952 TaxID=3154851 RepID=UPI00344946D2
MKRRKMVGLVAGVVALAGAALAPAAQATGTTTAGATAACTTRVGSVTAAGGHSAADVIAGTPPTMTKPGVEPGVYPPGKVRVSTQFIAEPNVAGVDRYGYVIEGDSLYYHFYNPSVTDPVLKRVGGGWTNFTALEISSYTQAKPYHTFAYGLRSDGTLFRWSLGSGWKAAGSATGFASVKSIALISKTGTYDTFLANTRGGALYTIRIPVSAPMKPIVKQVRAKTWQGFEKLIVEKCGKSGGTMVVGIDEDTNSGYAYAFGHANGTATVINGLGKVNGTFADDVYFRWGVVSDLDPINGE